MSQATTHSEIQQYLRDFQFRDLFIEVLGWDYLSIRPLYVEVDGHTHTLTPVAEKRGFVVFQCSPDPEGQIPQRDSRVKIEQAISKQYFQNILIFADAARNSQTWLWRRMESGKPASYRHHSLGLGQSGLPLAQRLQTLVIAFDEEEDTTHVDVTLRATKAFDVEKVTKKFYDLFKKERDTFHDFIENIPDEDDRSWYSSVMLNRLMFVYFIQKQGHLDGDQDYLRHRLERLQRERGNGHFFSFYRQFLLRLFHEGLGKQPSDRPADLDALIGRVPYLNGGIFDVHQLEAQYDGIQIPDEAFQRLFDFFDAYQWHLDDRPLRDDRQINPDVLGYIFEKYINQKEMGAYYTKEDITEYISKNTILPWLLDTVRKDVRIAFDDTGYVWNLLRENPDRYIYDAVKHGADQEIPPEVAAGIDDVSQRGLWNTPAPESHGLPTEIWREYIARRQRYEEIREKLVDGQVTDVNDLITYNLNIRQFTQDIVDNSEGPELTRAFWKALRSTTVLDPTCGSGAFLFAALNVLEPLYRGCLESMQAFVDDADRNPDRFGPGRFSDFRNVLEEVDRHPNRRYFILKSIIVNNLYGVDIMDEAVEICKLRLFLKLMSHVREHGQIEPLPDIDFNIRAGNTLVGFSSLDEVRLAIEGDEQKGTQRQLDLGSHIGRITELAEEAANIFQDFHYMQTKHGVSAEVFRSTKEDLDARLGKLRIELDRALASRSGLFAYTLTQSEEFESKFDHWLRLEQPFHWWAEFHDIMTSGGFDCVIGNPPYVARTKIEYEPWGEPEQRFKDLYAYVTARSLDLSNRGHIGMIVPLSITFSDDYKPLREVVFGKNGADWFSSFDNIPAALFTGVSQRCTIWIHTPLGNGRWSASLRRWRSEYRKHLFDNLRYTDVKVFDLATYGIPKVETQKHVSVLKRFASAGEYEVKPSKESSCHLYFSPSARNFLSVGKIPPPVYNASTLEPLVNDRHHSFPVLDQSSGHAQLSCLASNVSFWHWLVRGDGFDVTSWILRSFAAPIGEFDQQTLQHLASLGRVLDAASSDALAFKKNAGKFVGNYNYRRLLGLVRRADFLMLSGLGVSRSEAVELLEFVERTLAINTQAGEKSIPPEIREQVSGKPRDPAWESALLEPIDQFIKERFDLDPSTAFGVDRESVTQGTI